MTAPKSVSVLWALADDTTPVIVYDAHRAALASSLKFVEQRVIRTRIGDAGRHQVHTRGMVAAAFDHWDTRAGDPNLHAHVVIANKVQGPDGAWRSLDGRTVHAAVVTVSELYDALLADDLARRLPVEWTMRDRGRAGTRRSRSTASATTCSPSSPLGPRRSTAPSRRGSPSSRAPKAGRRHGWRRRGRGST